MLADADKKRESAERRAKVGATNVGALKLEKTGKPGVANAEEAEFRDRRKRAACFLTRPR